MVITVKGSINLQNNNGTLLVNFRVITEKAEIALSVEKRAKEEDFVKGKDSYIKTWQASQYVVVFVVVLLCSH